MSFFHLTLIGFGDRMVIGPVFAKLFGVAFFSTWNGFLLMENAGKTCPELLWNRDIKSQMILFGRVADFRSALAGITMKV